MYDFLIPLLIGFVFNWASAFTGFFVRRWGERGGRATTFVLRNILGIPVWAIGLILAFREPAAPLIALNPGTRTVGWGLIIIGLIPMIWGLARLGLRSFRPTSQDTLVSEGIYEHIRHPIYSGLLFILLGGAIIHPAVPSLIACGLCVGYAFVQARLEEVDLVRRIPSYRDYMKHVPRFFPRLGN
jgi:protein-S-isoprenylcysteine O-methyltransferase Ste14